MITHTFDTLGLSRVLDVLHQISASSGQVLTGRYQLRPYSSSAAKFTKLRPRTGYVRFDRGRPRLQMDQSDEYATPLQYRPACDTAG